MFEKKDVTALLLRMIFPIKFRNFSTCCLPQERLRRSVHLNSHLRRSHNFSKLCLKSFFYLQVSFVLIALEFEMNIKAIEYKIHCTNRCLSKYIYNTEFKAK